MNSSNTKDIFRTADLAITAALSVSGFVVDEVEKVSPTRSVFIFIDSAELQEAINKFWRGEMLIEPMAFFNQLKLLKARIYER
ncbi:MAG: DUF5659 domain-containing protein [Candidatus Nealsonbacteria bacterium]|nr:DUF5659 domain-containing protein [Candidatus Nealsonbacteria bacterium]